MNKSGITPVEFNVLIDQDPVSEMVKGSTVIRKTNDAMERDYHGQTRGTIIALSPLAFNTDIWPGDLPKPMVGQRVVFAKHSGTFCDGADGKEYRIVKDKDIVAVMA